MSQYVLPTKQRYGEYAYSFREDGFNSTSFGISANGVLEVGGVLMKEGGNPGGICPVTEPNGCGVALGAGVAPFNNPAARNCSSKDFGSGTGTAEGKVAGTCGGGDFIAATG